MNLLAIVTQTTEQTAVAPWWGVPALTGAATLFGALIAFFSVRASDNRKAKREREQRIMIETRDAGLEFLGAARHIEQLVKRQQTASRNKPIAEHITDLFDAIIDVEEKWGKFQLFAHDKALESGRELMASALSLMIPALDDEGTSKDLGEFGRKRLDFMNTLREASGVKKIERDSPDPIARKEFMEQNTELLSKIYERYMSDYEKEPPK